MAQDNGSVLRVLARLAKCPDFPAAHRAVPSPTNAPRLAMFQSGACATRAEAMEPERYQHIKSVLQGELEQPVGDHERWLARRCGEDAALRRELEALPAGENHQKFMEHSPLSLTLGQEQDSSGSRLRRIQLQQHSALHRALADIPTNNARRVSTPSTDLGAHPCV